MNAPVIWIFFPALLGLILLALRKQHMVVYLIGVTGSAVLTLLAWLLKVDNIYHVGNFEIKISSSMLILGRELILITEQQSIIIMIFGIVTFWLFGAVFQNRFSLFPSVTLIMASCLVASLAVVPFLYAAILIELASLVSLIVFFQQGKTLKTGAVRYLTYQTIGMAFLLMSGWMLSGVEIAPTTQIASIRILVILGLGFAFLLAIFPFYSWIPMLAEEENPYIAGFIILLLQSAIIFMAINFLDKNGWLRNSESLKSALLITGSIMVVTGGVWAAFQKNLGRIFGYALIVENGLSLLAIGLMSSKGLELFSGMIIPKMITFGMWAFCLSIFLEDAPSLKVDDMRGMGKQRIVLLGGLLFAQFSLGGLPLLAGFPFRMALLTETAFISPIYSWAILIGTIGIWAAGWFSLSVLVDSNAGWGKISGTKKNNAFIILMGILWLITLGVVPNISTDLGIFLLSSFSNL